MMEQRNKQQNNGGGTIEHHKGTRSNRLGAYAQRVYLQEVEGTTAATLENI